MKIIYRILALAGFTLFLNACRKEDGNGPSKLEIVLPQYLTHDRVLKSDTTYVVDATFIVQTGVTLTIEPGTLIKVKGSSSTGIYIARGAKIMAAGTAEKPIVFTSAKPAGQRQHGEWSGLYIYGNAPVSAYDMNWGTPLTEMVLDGVNNEQAGGGPDPDDNSGILKYVRIEFAGNSSATSYGLGCVGVGAGTTIENVEVSYTQTSGFGFHGGTVNARNLVAFSNRLTGFVYANGYNGHQQFIVSYKHPYFAAQGIWTYTCDAVLTLNDIKANPLERNTRPVISNLTVVGPYNNPGYNNALPWNAAVNVYYSSELALRNAVIMGMPKGGIRFTDDAAALHLLDGTTDLSYNLLHSNVADEAFGIDPNYVYSIDAATAAVYAQDHHNIGFNKPEDIQLNAPFIFRDPGLLPKTGSPAGSGANFDGPDFNTWFNKVDYRGAFGTVNWMAGWTNFYPVEEAY